MVIDKSIVSFAIMSLQWSRNNKDYIDTIIPFVLKAIKLAESRTKCVSVSHIRNILKDEFGLDFPNNFVEAILRRLCKKEYGYLKIDNGIFRQTDKEIDMSQFKSNHDSVINHQLLVIDELKKFVKELLPEFDYDENRLESQLVLFLNKYGLEAIANKKIKEKVVEDKHDIYSYCIGKFIENIQVSDAKLFKYVMEIVKGAMLATSIYMQENNHKLKLNSNFDELLIFYDTPLLLYTLGYSGGYLKQSCLELLELVQNLGGSVKYYYHNLEEVQDILDAFVDHYRNGTLDNSYNFEYLIESKVTADEAVRYKASIVADLKSKGIELYDAPEITPQNNCIDWTKLDDYLKSKMFYKNSIKRDNDIKSVIYTYIIRRRTDYRRIENCRAIFIATNMELVQTLSKYFKEKELRKDYPIIIHDTLLTSIAWMKSFTNSDEIPTLRIIADALASQMPSQEFWNDFNKAINSMVERKTISQDECFELKYDLLVKKQMYEMTLGDTSKISHDNVERVLQDANKRKNAMILEELNQVTATSDMLFQELIQEKANKYLNGLSKWKIVNDVSKAWLFYFSAFVIGLGLLFTSFIQIAKFRSYGKMGLVAYIILSILYKIVDKVFDIKYNTIQQRICKYSYNLLARKVQSNDKEYQKDILMYLVKQSKRFEIIGCDL